MSTTYRPTRQQVPHTCTLPGCERPHRARGWCAAHYERWQRHGDPLGEHVRPQTCTVAGCERPHRAKGLCVRHESQRRREALRLRDLPAPAVPEWTPEQWAPEWCAWLAGVTGLTATERRKLRSELGPRGGEAK